MKYQMTIIQLEENKNYANEMADYNNSKPYRDFDSSRMPSQFIEKRVLNVDVDEVEFKTIKKAVMEIM